MPSRNRVRSHARSILWGTLVSLQLYCEGKHRRFGPTAETVNEASSPLHDGGAADAAAAIPLCAEVPACTTGSSCDVSSCIECVDNSHCPARTPQCDVNAGACVECVADVDCPIEAPRCRPESQTCEQCIGDLDCTSPTRCDRVSARCIGCSSNNACPSGSLCRTTDGVCVQCINSNAPCRSPAAVCEIQSGTCVECIDDSTCLDPNTARCERSASAPVETRFTCVRCESHSECANKPSLGPYCSDNGTCVECKSNSDCIIDATKPRCDISGECGECVNDDDCSLVTERPACATTESGARCAECTRDEHCASNPASGRCQADPIATRAHTCVQCLEDADCTDPLAPRCEQNVCAPCISSENCGHIPGRNVCDNQECVQCTGAERDACSGGAGVCNALTRTCTLLPVGSAGLCDTCVSDAHCSANGTSFCAVQLFAGSEVGHFCFPASSQNGCSLTPFSNPIPMTTIDGDSALLCMLRLTTCPALSHVETLSCAMPEDCGEPGIDDGRCLNGLCSLPCATGNDCFNPGAQSCIGAVCQLG